MTIDPATPGAESPFCAGNHRKATQAMRLIAHSLLHQRQRTAQDKASYWGRL